MNFEQLQSENISEKLTEKEITNKLEGKEIIWRQKLDELNSVADRLKRPIDGKIIETVAALQLNGFPTTGSCEGHIDSGYPAPWVDVAAVNEPEERFIGQKELFKKMANKYSISLEEAEHNQEIFDKVIEECLENGETKEYKQWKEENNRLLLEMTDLLSDFYKNRTVSSDRHLKLRLISGISFRIHNGGNDYEKIKKDRINSVKNENKSGLKDRLLDYQEEMKDFTIFLKEKIQPQKGSDNVPAPLQNQETRAI